ncbi:hypothetical protein ACIBCM_11595 [Streptomyces sp. NPDC051018]|uniref:hypothetical protein n=1 Tax=Streptomyces sp. NPDC051018 TaxID=3365639 RepID=UPI00378D3082
MNTAIALIAVLAIAGLITLPSLLGHARDRAIDRQLREAARLESESWVPSAPRPATPRRIADATPADSAPADYTRSATVADRRLDSVGV